MKAQRALYIVLLLVLTSGSVWTAAQRSVPGPSVLRWTVRVVDAADRLPTPRSYRLYEEPTNIALQFALINESSDDLMLDPTAFLDRLDVRVVERASGLTVPTVTGMAQYAPLLGQPPSPNLLATLPVDLSPGAVSAVTVNVGREDGLVFAPGAYDVDIRVADAFASIRHSGGNSWVGRYLQETKLQLEVAAPRTAGESSEMYRRSGTVALIAGRTEHAIELFSKALVTDPADLESLAGLGHAYVRAQRYRDAIGPLEQVLSRQSRGHSGVPGLLALAYLGSDDDAGARRALRRAGRSEAAISVEIMDLRTKIRRR